APIGRSPTRRTRMAIRDEGRAARTAYEVRAEYGDPIATLVECRLETGRTHQLRVHLSAVGHAVVGAAAYRGGPAALPLHPPFLLASLPPLAPPTAQQPPCIGPPLATAPPSVLAGREPASG